jgi:STE24 endopeptidase
MTNILYYLILIILVADFVFERWLEYLNTTKWSNALPEQLKGIYNEEKYRLSQDYERTKHRFSKLTESLGFIIVLALFAGGAFGWLDNSIRKYVDHPIYTGLVFFAIIGFASSLFSLPFSYYATFVIEERFGFNKSSVKTFFGDFLKGLVISALIGGVLLSLIIWIYVWNEDYFWLLAFGIIALFMLFMTTFYSNIIVPLFNKQTPLEDGPLKDKINAFCDKVGFKLDNVFVIDGSKRSSKANAYFTGLGKRKRIVLYDTLISEMDEDEIVAVLAHEIGHYKKKHVVSSLIISLLNTLLTLYIFNLVAGNPDFTYALKANIPSFHISVVTFGILFTPLSFLTAIFMNILSRTNEFEADNFAAKNSSASALSSALKNLSINNLSNLTPHPIYVFFHYSHPTLLQRLNNLSKFNDNN